MPHILTPAGELYYHKEGSGPALVLLHGFPASSSLWRLVTPALASSFTVITPDLPGTGASKYNGSALTMDLLAESVLAVLDKENIDNTVLCGHSMGGYVALAFAANYPSRLAGLSLIHSTAYADDEERKQIRRKAIDLIRKGGQEPFIRQTVPGLFAAETKKGRSELVSQQVMEGLSPTPETLVACYEAMINRAEHLHTLKNASFPVCWIAGRHDGLIPVSKVLQQCWVSSVSFVSICERSGHMSMLEEPDRVVKDLKEFNKYCYSKL
jgi:pimeloyl-ACP methyl ester carboxylesterase